MKSLAIATLFLMISVQCLKYSSLKSGNSQSYKDLAQGVFKTESNCQTSLSSNLKPSELDVKLDSNEQLFNFYKTDWIKNWGFGSSAYLYDFLDGSLLASFVEISKTIIDKVMTYESENYKGYSDPFITKIIDPLTKEVKNNLIEMLSLKKSYDPEIFENSANSVQLRQAFEEFAWEIKGADSGDKAVKFIQKYDLNRDTRLNPRELILGVITENQENYRKSGCTLCFEAFIPNVEAIFTFIDCDNNGFVNGEELVNNLKNLKREVGKWNMFAGVSEASGIRTSAINHFILNNQSASNGELNKAEFTSAVMYGLWNRQTTQNAIISDASRSLKDLRWGLDGNTDKGAADYISKNRKSG